MYICVDFFRASRIYLFVPAEYIRNATAFRT